MFSIIICDDEIIDRRLLRAMLEKYISVNHIYAHLDEFSSADEFLSRNPDVEPDLIFLDIYMEGMDGIELARKIREQNSSSQIIFTTSSNEFAADAFEVEAFSYLRKPLSEQKLTEVLDRIMQHRLHTRCLDLYYERSHIKIYLSDIVYIETLGRRLSIHTADDSFMVYMSLSKIIEDLPDTEFVRTSRFEITSLSHIKLINGRELELSDGTKLQISQNFYDDLICRYDTFRRRVSL